MRVEKISVGPAVLEVITVGSGDTVVLLPIAGGDIAQFHHFASVLGEAGFQTVAINPRGVSESTGPLEGLTLHELAADVGGVISALGTAPAHVVGTAFGNVVTRCLAADRPDLVRTVILVAAGGLARPDPEAAAALRTFFRPDVSDEERQEAAALALLSPTSDSSIVQQLRIWPAAAAQVAAGEATPLEEWWTAGQAPMLVIQGLDDRSAPPANGRDLRERLGDRVRLVELANAGHLPLLEQPAEVAEAVIAFLREH